MGYVVSLSSFAVAYNGLRLQDVGDYTTNIDVENQTLIYHKCV